MSKRIPSSAFLALALLSVTAQARAATTVTSLTLEDVVIRPGVTVDLRLRVHERSGVPCEASTVLLIPGAGTSSASLAGLADALIDDDERDRPVCRALVLDLPAHGQSSPPVGALFGDLSIDDYASTVISALARLRQLSIRPWTLIGHSLGGAIIQRVQHRLLEQGSSLKAIGVRHVVFLAPGIPSGSPWALRDLGLATYLMGPFHVLDPVLGDIVSLPPEFWPIVALQTLDGTILEHPTVAELIAMNFAAPESWNVMAGTLNMGAGMPNTVAPGVFASEKGTRLDIVAFSQDILLSTADLTALFGYLTAGRSAKSGLTIIDTPEAVHAMPIVFPLELVEILADDVSFP